jgi:hypothetical protein
MKPIPARVTLVTEGRTAPFVRLLIDYKCPGCARRYEDAPFVLNGLAHEVEEPHYVYLHLCNCGMRAEYLLSHSLPALWEKHGTVHCAPHQVAA